MKSKLNLKPLPGLAELEREVLAEAREWGRQRFEERLQQLVEEHREAFPPQATQKAAGHAAQRTGRGQRRS
jgi:hypothetical protein